MNQDEKIMTRCIELALRASGQVAPNPMVGAVLVHDSRIIGEGWHEEYGQAHAEINCVNSAIAAGYEHLLESSTLYVSLEPCSHTGKTPPCTDLILKHRIPKVVIGVKDPFDKVNGSGIARLLEAGTVVHCGILGKECTSLNKRFFTFHLEGRPFIILKWAQTTQGIIGSGESRLLISNELTNRLVHSWRSEEAAIMVGANTARIDNPSLTNRHWPGKSPVRLLVDPELTVGHDLRLFDGVSPLVIFNRHRHEVMSGDRFAPGVVNYYRLEHISVPNMCKALHELNLLSVLVEGGAKLLQSFIDSGYWDEARVITSNVEPAPVPAAVRAPMLGEAIKLAETRVGSDQLIFFEPVR